MFLAYVVALEYLLYCLYLHRGLVARFVVDHSYGLSARGFVGYDVQPVYNAANALAVLFAVLCGKHYVRIYSLLQSEDREWGKALVYP